MFFAWPTCIAEAVHLPNIYHLEGKTIQTVAKRIMKCDVTSMKYRRCCVTRTSYLNAGNHNVCIYIKQPRYVGQIKAGWYLAKARQKWSWRPVCMGSERNIVGTIRARFPEIMALNVRLPYKYRTLPITNINKSTQAYSTFAISAYGARIMAEASNRRFVEKSFSPYDEYLYGQSGEEKAAVLEKLSTIKPGNGIRCASITGKTFWSAKLLKWHFSCICMNFQSFLLSTSSWSWHLPRRKRILKSI